MRPKTQNQAKVNGNVVTVLRRTNCAKVDAFSSQTKGVVDTDVDEYDGSGTRRWTGPSGCKKRSSVGAHFCKLQEILWLSTYTSFNYFPLVNFSEHQNAQGWSSENLCWHRDKVFFQVSWNFLRNCPFQSEIMACHWNKEIETRLKAFYTAELVISLQYSVQVVLVDETNAANLVFLLPNLSWMMVWNMFLMIWVLLVLQ